jgi:hypothetical protein
MSARRRTFVQAASPVLVRNPNPALDGGFNSGQVLCDALHANIPCQRHFGNEPFRV